MLYILGAELPLVQQKMFGGMALMLPGNLACGAMNDGLIVRVPKDEYEAALTKPHVRELDFIGRPMRGWVVGGSEATDVAAGLGGNWRGLRAEPVAQVTRPGHKLLLPNNGICTIIRHRNRRLGWPFRRPNNWMRTTTFPAAMPTGGGLGPAESSGPSLAIEAWPRPRRKLNLVVCKLIEQASGYLRPPLYGHA